MPPEVKEYKQKGEPKTESNEEDSAFLSPSDEKALRETVTRLALLQARKMSPQWTGKQRDCSGLVRFAYREALEVGSPKEKQKLGIPDALHLPAVSELSKRVVSPISPNLAGGLGQTTASPGSAPLPTPKRSSASTSGRRPATCAHARNGDLLVFQKALEGDQPYHLMIFVEDRPGNLAVYHNGARRRRGPGARGEGERPYGIP